jgi:hypothetical protein
VYSLLEIKAERQTSMGYGVYYHIMFVTSLHVLHNQGPATSPGVYEVASFC